MDIREILFFLQIVVTTKREKKKNKREKSENRNRKKTQIKVSLAKYVVRRLYSSFDAKIHTLQVCRYYF